MSILHDFQKNIEQLQRNSIINSNNDCATLKVKFKIKNKEYIEQFRQISKNNNEIWSCSCNSILFTNQTYNIYTLSSNEEIELNNLSNLLKLK